MQVVVDQCYEKLASCPAGHARRLFHGRGHCFPGFEHVVVNWYPPYIQVALYQETPRAWIDQLVKALINDAVAGVVVQFRDGRKTITETWYQEVPDEHAIKEAGLTYCIQPKRNQNVGLFMDMAHIRQYLSQDMQNKKVLNLFAYTCAFSVSAIANGASLVVNNDMNANVLKVGQRNHLSNQHDMQKVRMLAHNVLKAWKKIRQYGPYDIIIIDPPTNQKGSFVAEKDYAQVLKRLPELTAKNAQVIACLNSPFLGQDFLSNHMSRFAPQCRYVETFAHHEDFPEAFGDRGLKVQRYSAPG